MTEPALLTRSTVRHPTWRGRLAPLVAAWRPLVAVAAMWTVALIAAGLLLTGPLADSGIVRTDLAIERWLAEHRSGALDALAEAGTWFSETFVVPVVLLVAIVAAWRKSTNVAAPVFLALAVAGEKLMYLIASVVVGRDRPPVPTVGTTYATSSFPSGHVASAITLYGGIALVVTARRSHAARRIALVIVGVVAAVVAVCRMYAGFHYLSDCIAGALTGVVWLTATYRLVFVPGWTGPAQASGRVRQPLPEVREGHSEAVGVRSRGGGTDAVGSGVGVGDGDRSHTTAQRAQR
jgi:membrane-associated phospholipid phosphatase